MIFERLDKILAQGEAGPIFGHQDTAHIAMALESNAEQVKDFTFHPISGTPDAFGGRNGWIFARQPHFQDASMAMAIGKEMVNDFDAIFAVDAGLIIEAIHGQAGIVAEPPTNLK